MASALERVSQAYQAAHEIPFSDSSKIVIMSDCHRGDGNGADAFANNQNLYFVALSHYYKEKYTYIELGDGDELWENRSFLDIISTYKNVFWLMSQFYKENRLYLTFGNHDIVKQKSSFVKNNLDHFYDEREKKNIPLFPNIKIYEGLLLKHTPTQHKIFLLHGHQADFLNDPLWRLSRFLVRYVWKPMELIGVTDPTSASKNSKRKNKVERKLTQWGEKEKQMLIAGHTHRPAFPQPGEPLYFNDGSCVHPRCITALEIKNGALSLVKWSNQTKADGTLYVGRDTLAGPEKLKDYFEKI